MKTKIITIFLICFGFCQDTFSIVAVNPYTGEVGSAGASCIAGSIIISDVHPGYGAIHTQSYWLSGNQNLASDYMGLGYNPQQIMDSLVVNDVQNNPTIRQYGAVDLVDKFDNVDFLINNAGIEIYREFENYQFDEIEKIFKVNLLGPMELTRQLIPKIKQNKGHIVNIASLAGKKGVVYNGVYSATKSGLILWSDALDQELRESGVGVTAVCPGYIAETGMFNDGGYPPPPLLGESDPRKVGKAVIDAITKKKKEIIVNSGPIRPLLAIAQIFPSLSDTIVNWFGVPELCRKRAFESKGGNRT